MSAQEIPSDVARALHEAGWPVPAGPPVALDPDLTVTCSKCSRTMPLASWSLHKRVFCGRRGPDLPEAPFEKGAP